MQGITVALSKEGIEFFVKTLTAPGGSVYQALTSKLTLADRTLTIPDFEYKHFDMSGGNQRNDYSNISIQLNNGSLSGYNPTYGSLVQQSNGAFQLALSSGSFSANYNWNESYDEQDWYEFIKQGHAPTWLPEPGYDSPVWKPNNIFGYSAGIGSLDITANFSFTFNSSSNTYTLPITSIAATANNLSANIPGSSIVQHQDYQACVGYRVDDATTQAVDNTDFTSAIQDAFGGSLTSISASGQLTPEIVFDFGLGDSGLAFPGDPWGITIGAKGASTYRKQPYPVAPKAPLSVPSVPTDGHHLQMYVSDYTINGLYWAFALDGKLTSTVQPSNLPDPSVLYVSTYYNAIPSTDPLSDALAPYQDDNMSATVSPQVKGTTIQPPTVAFQPVYVFNPTTMALLQNVLPADVYKVLAGKSVSSQAFTNTKDLEAALTRIKIDKSYFSKIESTVQEVAALVSHDLQFTLAIEGEAPINGQPPYLTFTLTRQDILTNLHLGFVKTITNPKPAQTLQFTHTECQPPPVATLTDSNFIDVTPENSIYFSTIWSMVGETEYSLLLEALGYSGVPLPIMDGFQFLFDQALLNIEQGYVGILADVEFIS